MTVKIGHASLDENNKAKGGIAGDQTSKEVRIQDWYLRSKGWSVVFRPKERSVAEKIAKAMEQACHNNNIGYDQGQRTTLYRLAEKVNWDLSKVAEKCECDCSSLVAVCLMAAGIRVSKDMYTGNQMSVLQATNRFNILSGAEYLTKSDYLQRGDILLGPGHTAVVLSNSANKQVTEPAKSFSGALKGTYAVTASKLNLRAGAGVDKAVLATIQKGTKVTCYGYYTAIAGTNWLYVQVTPGALTGFVSAKYLTVYDC